MPIREFSLGIPRARIAFFPQAPGESELARFKERGFSCSSCTEAQLRDPSFIALIDAVVFLQSAERRNALSTVLHATVPPLLNHDVHCFARDGSSPIEP